MAPVVIPRPVPVVKQMDTAWPAPEQVCFSCSHPRLLPIRLRLYRLRHRCRRLQLVFAILPAYSLAPMPGLLHLVVLWAGEQLASSVLAVVALRAVLAGLASRHCLPSSTSS